MQPPTHANGDDYHVGILHGRRRAFVLTRVPQPEPGRRLAFLPAVDFGTADKARILPKPARKGHTPNRVRGTALDARPPRKGSMTVKAIDVPEISNSDPWTAYEAEIQPPEGRHMARESTPRARPTSTASTYATSA